MPNLARDFGRAKEDLEASLVLWVSIQERGGSSSLWNLDIKTDKFIGKDKK